MRATGSAGSVLVVVNDLQDAKALAATLAQLHRDEPKTRIHLLAPQQPPSGYARHHLRGVKVEKALRATAEHEMEALAGLLDAAGVPHQRHVKVGPWLETIAAVARDCDCRRIYLGDNRASFMKSMLLRHDCALLHGYLARNGITCRVMRRDESERGRTPPASVEPRREPCMYCAEGASGEGGHPGVSVEANAISASDRTFVRVTCRFCGTVWARRRLSSRLIEWLRIAA